MAAVNKVLRNMRICPEEQGVRVTSSAAAELRNMLARGCEQPIFVAFLRHMLSCAQNGNHGLS